MTMARAVRPWTFLPVVLLVAFTVEAQPDRDPLNVYLVARQAVPAPADKRALRKQFETTASDTRNAARALEEALRKQFGRRQEAWPEDKKQELRVAQNAAADAVSDLTYFEFQFETTALGDSVDDIKKSIAGSGMAGKKAWLRVVDRPEDAHLVAEVIGRRSESQPPFINGMMYVALKVSAGGRVKPAALVGLTPKWRGRSATAESPFWVVEASGPERYGSAANNAANSLQEFVKTHFDELTRGATQ